MRGGEGKRGKKGERLAGLHGWGGCEWREGWGGKGVGLSETDRELIGRVGGESGGLRGREGRGIGVLRDDDAGGELRGLKLACGMAGFMHLLWEIARGVHIVCSERSELYYCTVQYCSVRTVRTTPRRSTGYQYCTMTLSRQFLNE